MIRRTARAHEQFHASIVGPNAPMTRPTKAPWSIRSVNDWGNRRGRNDLRGLEEHQNHEQPEAPSTQLVIMVVRDKTPTMGTGSSGPERSTLTRSIIRRESSAPGLIPPNSLSGPTAAYSRSVPHRPGEGGAPCEVRVSSWRERSSATSRSHASSS